MAAKRPHSIILYILLGLYSMPLLVVCGAELVRLVTLPFARNLIEVYTSGPQYFVGPVLIPFLTLFSARRQTDDEVVWNGATLVLFALLVVLCVLSWIVSAMLKDNLSVAAVVGMPGLQELYSTTLRYGTETMSFAGLVVGIRYQLAPQASNGQRSEPSQP